MRTSYDRMNSAKQPTNKEVSSPVNMQEISKDSADESSTILDKIVLEYASVKDSIDAKSEKAQSANSVNSVNNEPVSDKNPSDGRSSEKSSSGGKSGVQSEKVKKAKQKKSKKGIIFAVLLVVILVAVAVFLVQRGIISFGPLGNAASTEESTVAYEPQLGNIANDIAKLYTSDEKTDVVEGLASADLEPYYSRLSEASLNGEDTEELVNELTTISDYLYDRSRLNIFETADYDLSLENFSSDVLKVKSSADNYSIQSLKGTIYARADALIAMREEYFRIKSSLLGVSDLLEFDKSSYEESIKDITHTPNANELTLLLSKVYCDSVVAVAEESLKTAEDKGAAEKALADAVIAQEEASNAWLAYTGDSGELPVYEVSEPVESTPEEG